MAGAYTTVTVVVMLSNAGNPDIPAKKSAKQQKGGATQQAEAIPSHPHQSIN